MDARTLRMTVPEAVRRLRVFHLIYFKCFIVLRYYLVYAIQERYIFL
jgi:hypothetical protein